MTHITTSWDDGHELDFKLADLLHKYSLKATFYIPKSNSEHTVMTESQVQQLATQFEIGGHTLNHTRLVGLNKQQVVAEVEGCYEWLSQLLGKQPVSFCFPGGAFDEQSLSVVNESGFQLSRTTELLSVKTLNEQNIIPTSLQVYEHSRFTYIKHLVKRKRWHSLLQWIKTSSSSLESLTKYNLQQAAKVNGCFHLWGHSWEIEEYHLWKKLEDLFKIIADHTEVACIENKELMDTTT